MHGAVRAVWLPVLAVLATTLFLPAAADAKQPDADRDGLSNRQELRRYHTLPRKADTDRDALRDGFEVRITKTNPRRADTDGDGASDGREVLLGTNPRTTAKTEAPAGRPHCAPDLAQLGPLRLGRLGQRDLLVHFVGGALDLPVPARRRRLGVLLVAQAVLGNGERPPPLRRARQGRGRQRRRVAGVACLDGERGVAGHDGAADDDLPGPERHRRRRLGELLVHFV